MSELDSPPGTEDKKDMFTKDNMEMIDEDANNPVLTKGLDVKKSKNLRIG